MKRSFLLCASLLAASNRGRPLDQAPPKEASRANPYEQQAEAQKAGRKLYLRECSSCHGERGEGGRHAPALAPSMDHAQPGAIFWVLRNGSIWRGMPSFSHLPEAQCWQIVAYLKTMR